MNAYHYRCDAHTGSHCPDCDGAGMVAHEGSAHELSRKSAIGALDHEIRALWKGLDRAQRDAHKEAERYFDRPFFGFLGMYAAAAGKPAIASAYQRCAALCEAIREIDDVALALAASVLCGGHVEATDRAALARIRPVKGGYEVAPGVVVVDPTAAFQVAIRAGRAA